MKPVTKELNIILVDDDKVDRDLIAEAFEEVVENVNLVLFKYGAHLLEKLIKIKLRLTMI